MSMTPPELHAFIVREHPRLLASVSLMMGDDAVAEEIVQDALVEVASRWGRVSQMASPGGYAHRTAMNMAKSRLRRRGAERRARARAGHERDVVHHDPDTADRLAVRQALQELPAARREAVVLRWLVGLSVDDTATSMGRTPQAVRNLTHRGLQQLRDLLATDVAIEEPADVH